MSPEITKIIEQYLQNELSAADRQIFEARLAHNDQLLNEVVLQRRVHESAKRASQRAMVQQTAKSYHLRKTITTAAVVVIIASAIAAATWLTVRGFDKEEAKSEKLTAESYVQLVDQIEKNPLPIDNIPTQYFNLPAEDTVVLSAEGVLLSVPDGAFMLNGQPYHGAKIVQWQEALSATDIVKAGLSTMSGNKILETQGMFGMQAFTPDGKELDINPKVGVYAQVPVNENRTGMQLFEGRKDKNGVIDWENPKPLEKLPVLADMNDLDFYPPGYEPKLDELKWKTEKKDRDSLYLSFEKEDITLENNASQRPQPMDSVGVATVDIPYKFASDEEPTRVTQGYRRVNTEVAKRAEKNWLATDVNTNISGRQPSKIADSVAQGHIPPSKVLGFWKPKFNNTILATRDFEKRMKSVHGTCKEAVLDKYTNNLNRPLYEIDAMVAKMGYPQFEAFAKERVGGVKLDNPHMNNLRRFYAHAVAELKKEAKNNRNFARDLEAKWDQSLRRGRSQEADRTARRNSSNYLEEYKLNYLNAAKQLGYTVGFTIRRRSAARSYNLDKYAPPRFAAFAGFVNQTTLSRTTATFTDPNTGRQATLIYNPFSVTVESSGNYEKLMVYLFPHELVSFHRIDPKAGGKFSYSLNNEITYDMMVVGMNEDGYHIYTKNGFNSGDLGTVQLKKVSEQEFGQTLEAMNAGKKLKKVRISDELDWLSKEQQNYKVQRLRKEQAAFRQEIRSVIFPCSESFGYEWWEAPGNPQ